MKSKLGAIIIIAIVLFSCKDDKNKINKEELNSKIEANNFFKVSLDLVVLKDDNFHLYYTEDGTVNFNEKQSIWVPINGSEKVQEVVYNLPEDVVPTHIRLDFGFGKNEAQSDVVIKSFKMNYFDKNFQVNDAKVFDYFSPNELSTIIDKPTSSLKRVKKDQETGPSLYPQILLGEEIAKMTK